MTALTAPLAALILLPFTAAFIFQNRALHGSGENFPFTPRIDYLTCFTS